MNVEFDKKCPVNEGYRNLLTQNIKQIEKRIGKTYPDVKWVIYEPGNSSFSQPTDNLMMMAHQIFPNKIFDVPTNNSYGFCLIGSKIINISTNSITETATITADNTCELSRLTEVIIHELAHIESKESDHDSPAFLAIFQQYKDLCVGL